MAIKDLTIDKDALEEESIEKIISPYVRYDPEKKEVVVLPQETEDLEIDQKVLIFLVALKGWRFFEVEVQSITARPKDIALAIRENPSTVRNHLQTLSKRGLIYKTEDGGYTVPNHAVIEVSNLIKNNE